MKRIITALISVFSFCLIVPAIYAQGPDAETRKFIEEFNIQEAAQPIREWDRWRKPDSVLMLVPGADLQARPDLLDWIREVMGDVELNALTGPGFFGPNPDAEELAQADVFLGYCAPQIIRAAPELRWVQNYGVGVDNCTAAEDIVKLDLLVTNNQHYSAPPIAEHVIALVMMLTRNLPALHAEQLKGNWDRGNSSAPMIEVKGKTMLVAGLGGIGTEVARLASALGMRVLATRNSSRSGPDFVEYVGLAPELNELASRADIIVNALPLTDKTTGIFNAEFFAGLQKGSYFVSVGRGGSTITGDLVVALKNGTLAGAGLDVTDPEPLPPGHELWTLTNVIISPHNSSTSDLALDRRWIVIRDNVRRYINGEKMLNVVDLERGY